MIEASQMQISKEYDQWSQIPFELYVIRSGNDWIRFHTFILGETRRSFLPYQWKSRLTNCELVRKMEFTQHTYVEHNNSLIQQWQRNSISI